MFTRSDLNALMDAAPKLGVSIFLPTHVRGSEVRQDPIRLKNLAAEAHAKLVSAGLSRPDADAVLAPAMALVDDYGFWQHQDQGLALFLSGGEERHFTVPIPLTEQVVVGAGFHVRPLLPVLAADGAFLVLTITADRVRLFDASRFAMAETDAAGLPRGLDDVTGDADYQAPVDASPVNRPNVGSFNISNAQVMGDSPEEWRKGRLVEFIRQVAAALESRLAGNPVPVVLVADAETGGHFQKLGTLGSQLAGVVETNPEAMDSKQLHEAAYRIVQPQLDAGRKAAVERFEALLGSGDARAATGIEEVARMAYHGRIDTLLLAESASVWGHYDTDADELATGEEFAASGEDLLDAVAARALRHGGSAYVLSEEEMPDAVPAAAILRY